MSYNLGLDILGGGGGGGGGGHGHGGGGHGHGGGHGGGRTRWGAPWGSYDYYDPEYVFVDPSDAFDSANAFADEPSDAANLVDAATVIDAYKKGLEDAKGKNGKPKNNKQDVLGMFDFNIEQRRMDAIKQVPVSVAQALLQGGMAAINGAIAGAKQSWYKADLPGNNSRSNVLGHLQWHASALAPLVMTPNAMYSSGDDLKSWVLAAYREANAVEAGAAYLESAWNTMWADIARAIAALPKEIADKISEIMPAYLKWGLGIGAGLLVLLGGAVVYRQYGTRG